MIYLLRENKPKGHGGHDPYRKGRMYAHEVEIEDVVDVIHRKPRSWDKHDDYLPIVDMEFAELTTERKSGGDREIYRELSEIAAACICAMWEIKQDERK